MAGQARQTGRGDSSGADAALMLSVSGCRGVVGSSLTPAVVCRYAGAFVSWLSEREGSHGRPLKIVLGGDGRLGSEFVRCAAVSELLASGCRVVDLGVAATPTVGVMVRHHGADGGLVITASHNPQQWNGVKPVTRDGRAPAPADAEKILAGYEDRRSAHVDVARVGDVDGDDTAAHVHVARILEALERVVPAARIRERRFKVAVDSVNASGRIGARMLLDALGCEAVLLNDDEGGVFPHAPEPTAENLSGEEGLRRVVADAGCDVGFAQDPDADRIAIVDERGGYIGEEMTLVFAAEALLDGAGDGAATAANLSTSRMIDDVAARHGARVVRTPVGEAHVVDAMQREGAPVGGEGNGGVIWPQVCLIRDSLSAMALTLALMTRRDKSVSALADGTPRYSIVKRKTPVDGLDVRGILEDVAAGWPDARVDRQDGVRIDVEHERAWLHVRPSNTEPILRLIAEAPAATAAEAMLDRAESLVRGG